MGKKKTCIWFVCWPDGRLFEGTQTSISEDHAAMRALRSFLPAQFFPGVDLGGRVHGAGYHLWPAMVKAGFKLNCIETAAEGIST